MNASIDYPFAGMKLHRQALWLYSYSAQHHADVSSLAGAEEWRSGGRMLFKGVADVMSAYLSPASVK